MALILIGLFSSKEWTSRIIFERHKLGDLFLDTFNVNAHTTTSDSLWAGLPVSHWQKSFSARVSLVCLTAVGMEELITENLNDYEKLAIELANNKSKLINIKQRLKNNVDSFRYLIQNSTVKI